MELRFLFFLLSLQFYIVLHAFSCYMVLTCLYKSIHVKERVAYTKKIYYRIVVAGGFGISCNLIECNNDFKLPSFFTPTLLYYLVFHL